MSCLIILFLCSMCLQLLHTVIFSINSFFLTIIILFYGLRKLFSRFILSELFLKIKMHT